ncbi:HlyD family type I secretion periplasmic adaptor subunit [Thermolongibacillus altinsuensis]
MPFLKRDKLEYEFLPAAIEIQERPPSPIGRFIIWFVVLIMLLAGTWSYIGKVDIVATARGTAVPDGAVKIIQPTDQGIIKAIHIKEGQKVNKGDILIELDPTIKEADLENREIELNILQLKKEVLEMIEQNKVLDINSLKTKYKVSDEVLSSHINHLRMRENEFNNKKIALELEIKQKEKELEKQKIQLENLYNKLNITKESNLVNSTETTEQTKIDWLTKETELVTLENDIHSQKLLLDSLKLSISEGKKQLEILNLEYKSELAREKAEITQQIAIVENEVEKAKKAFEYQNIKAPVDGTISNLANYTVGGVVSPNNAILSIVPDGTPLVFEGKILNKDIGYIKLGQHADIKLDTFPFQKYGTIPGRVVFISPDAIEDEKLGLVYKVKVKLEKNYVNVNGEKKFVTPGMTGSIEIKTGKRRIIEFFLSPIIKTVKESITIR